MFIMNNISETTPELALINRDIQGEIQQKGDTVHILTPGTVTTKEYTGSDIDPPEEPNDKDTIMTINQGHYFNVKVKDVDTVQQARTLHHGCLGGLVSHLKTFSGHTPDGVGDVRCQ